MSKQLDYQALNQELENVLSALQRPDVDVDEAVRLYEQGLKLSSALEKYIKTAENKINVLKLQQSVDGPTA